MCVSPVLLVYSCVVYKKENHVLGHQMKKIEKHQNTNNSMNIRDIKDFYFIIFFFEANDSFRNTRIFIIIIFGSIWFCQ